MILLNVFPRCVLPQLKCICTYSYCTLHPLKRNMTAYSVYYKKHRDGFYVRRVQSNLSPDLQPGCTKRYCFCVSGLVMQRLRTGKIRTSHQQNLSPWGKECSTEGATSFLYSMLVSMGFRQECKWL